jgi:hypothetical protein
MVTLEKVDFSFFPTIDGPSKKLLSETWMTFYFAKAGKLGCSFVGLH